MIAFDYSASPDPIRDDLAAAHRRAWQHIASAGTWLTGAERVAVARETRNAQNCALCAERKSALSPYSIAGEHDHDGVLPEAMVDEIHRVTTDAQRLTNTWYESLLAEGLPAERYVEALGVSVLVISIDAFHDAMGLGRESLPIPEEGEPSQYRPSGVVDGDAWVPTVDLKRANARDKGMLAGPGGRSAGVILALSLVPDQVRAWQDLAGGQYLSMDQMQRFDTVRAIDRSQIELIAGRVAALNECFY